MVCFRQKRLVLLGVLVLFVVLVPATAVESIQLGPFERVLERGATGTATYQLQGALVELGYELSLDGVFGRQTEATIRQYQRERGLVVDGIVGPQTWTALREELEPPDQLAGAAKQAAKYVVQRGDTLVSIAQRIGVPTTELIKLNELDNPDLIHIGDELKLPQQQVLASGSTSDGVSSKEAEKPAPVPSVPTPAVEEEESGDEGAEVQPPHLGEKLTRLTPPAVQGMDFELVAITFDDGPDPVFTPKLLEILDHFGAGATFFVVGEKVELYPEVVQAAAAAGHQLENHSYSHQNMVGFERERVQLELSRTSKLVEGLTGQPTHFFRPPFGAFDGDLVEALEETDHSLVLWNNVGGGDLDLSTPEMVLESTLSRAFPGAIIMLHATTPVTVEALPQLIAQLQARGLKLVTLNELLRAVETYESSK